MNYALLNDKIGQIIAPQEFIDSMTKQTEEDIINSFKPMLQIQPNESIAWGLAVNNVVSVWNGFKDIMNKIKK